MFCPNCGFNNTDESVFCVNCGRALQREDGLHPQHSNEWVPPKSDNMVYPPPKKSRKGLAIGICIGIIVLIAGAAALFFLLTGMRLTVAGQWYSEELGMVIEFGDGGTMEAFSSTGSDEGEYEYNLLKSEGVISLEGEEYAYKVEKDEMDIDSFGMLNKAEEEIDINEFIIETVIAGQWYN
ncbi:MAG: zinc-ribbon domain-containing protein, partial [Eubacteriales bacterium]|nr:zinc-ribbon domain-containing protein [Eubacteriales bacterium]